MLHAVLFSIDALTPMLIVCLDSEEAMVPTQCQRCRGSGCYRCESTKKCGGCHIALRVGCFDEGQSTCRTCLHRKKYTKRSALNDAVEEISLSTTETDIDIDEFIKTNTEVINKIVEEAVMQHKAVKVYITLDVQLSREMETGIQHNTGRFQTAVQLIGGGLHDLNIEEFRRNLHDMLDRFTNLGSGFTLERILKFVLHIAKYRPLVGSAYIPTSIELVGKQAIVNPKNDDNECFKWAVLASIFSSR
jgi:hypothetical protein